MGGSIGEGNRTPAAEFNIWADPEAAQRVFTSGLDVTMIGLDVTHQALVRARREKLRAAGRVGAFVAELRRVLRALPPQLYPELGGSPMHDPVAVAHVLGPGCVDDRPAFIEVDCSSGQGRGRTNVDWRGRHDGREPNAHVGLGIDADAFRALLIERIASLG